MNAALNLPHQTQANSAFEFNLLNAFQRDFPIVSRPYAAIAEQLGSDEDSIIANLGHLQQSGVVSRVGAVFRPNALGASALAALAVPIERLSEVANYISARTEINHNYEREHHYNLWFVANAETQEHLLAALQEIELGCACGSVLVLPMLEDFHIDLGFDLRTTGLQNQAQNRAVLPIAGCGNGNSNPPSKLNEAEKIILAALQNGLLLAPQPFAQLGVSEDQAIATITRWSEQGLIKRFGVIVRHHELGFNANAMVVWDVPDQEVSAVGHKIAASGRVTLCYRRPRLMPHWPYNLFCMIHGKDRAEVEAQILALAQACDLEGTAHTILFSRRRFKQRGAHYIKLSTGLENNVRKSELHG